MNNQLEQMTLNTVLSGIYNIVANYLFLLV